MGCKSLNCTVVDVIDANPDIAGGGVLAAFFLSAALTLLAIGYGYFTNSLPQWYLTETDREIISFINLDRVLEWCSAALHTIWSKIRKLFGLEVLPRRPRLSREQREEVVTRFILALSDQQLVTGLAILVGTAANQCTLTGYDFNMAFTLAWFSAITHLATLDVLRDYLIQHKTVRNWRIAGMIFMLIFLLYFRGVTLFKPDDSIPAECAFRPELVTSDRAIGLGPLPVLALIITVTFLLVNYWRRIQWSMRKTNGRLSTSYYFAFAVWKYSRYCPKELTNWKKMASDDVASFLEHVAIHDGFVLRRRQLELMKSEGNRFLSRHRRLFYGLLYASELRRNSFIAATPDIMFMLAYGISLVSDANWKKRTVYGSTEPWTSREVKVQLDQSMGFGQVTPMILLILPFLAAAEIYYDAKDKKTSKDDAHDDTPIVPLRVDTGLVAQSQEDQDLEQAAKKYDDNVSLIRHYFDIEPVEIDAKSASAQTADEIRSVWREKEKFYLESQELEAIRRKYLVSPTSIVLFLLVYSTAITITAGVTLNLYSNAAVVAGALLVAVYFFTFATGSIGTLIEAVRALQEKENVERIWKLIQKGKTPIDSTSTASSPAMNASPDAQSDGTLTPPSEDIALQNIPTHHS